MGERGLISNREVAAACRQGIWREKRIRTRRRGMSERSNTSRSSVSRDHGGEKNVAGMEKGRNERKDPLVLAGYSRDLRLSLCRLHFSHSYRHSFPFCAFFRRVHPGRGNQPFTHNDVPPPSTIHHHQDSSEDEGAAGTDEG